MNGARTVTRVQDDPPFDSRTTLFDEKGAADIGSRGEKRILARIYSTQRKVGHELVSATCSPSFAGDTLANDALDRPPETRDPVTLADVVDENRNGSMKAVFVHLIDEQMREMTLGRQNRGMSTRETHRRVPYTATYSEDSVLNIRSELCEPVSLGQPPAGLESLDNLGKCMSLHYVDGGVFSFIFFGHGEKRGF